MKRNWYAAIILLALCVLLFRAGQYVDRTTAGMQRQLEAAYALAEQGDYPAARRAYSRAATRALRSTQILGLLVRRNILDQLNQTLAVLPPWCRGRQPGRPRDGDAARLHSDRTGAAIIFQRFLSGCPAYPSVLP